MAYNTLYRTLTTSKSYNVVETFVISDGSYPTLDKVEKWLQHDFWRFHRSDTRFGAKWNSAFIYTQIISTVPVMTQIRGHHAIYCRPTKCRIMSYHVRKWIYPQLKTRESFTEEVVVRNNFVQIINEDFLSK